MTSIVTDFNEILSTLIEENLELEILDPFHAYGFKLNEELVKDGLYTFQSWRLDSSGTHNTWVPGNEWQTYLNEDFNGIYARAFLEEIGTKWDVASVGEGLTDIGDQLVVMIVTAYPAPCHDNWAPKDWRWQEE